ncbi:MAG: SemiSWEET family transporter [Magnetococcus sp. YQC-5]
MNTPLTLVELIGWFAVVLSSLSLLPQLWKAWQTRATKDLSLLWLIMALVSSLSWLTYGFLLPAQAVVVTNLIGGAIVLLLLIMKIRFG